jgi:hypothetical protein
VHPTWLKCSAPSLHALAGCPPVGFCTHTPRMRSLSITRAWVPCFDQASPGRLSQTPGYFQCGNGHIPTEYARSLASIPGRSPLTDLSTQPYQASFNVYCFCLLKYPGPSPCLSMSFLSSYHLQHTHHTPTHIRTNAHTSTHTAHTAHTRHKHTQHQQPLRQHQDHHQHALQSHRPRH